MKRNISLLLFATAAWLFVGCNNFLDKSPDSELNVDIDSEEKIAELLTGAYPEASYIPFLEPRTDNVEERVNGVHSRLNESMFFWGDYDQEDLDTPLNYWNACYKGIAQANKALELLSRYPKSERVKALYGEAFLLRAYLHFMLVNIWSEPYAQIEKDLKLGISLVSDIYYKHPKFHFNKKAAYAFASRFYLMKGEWKEVIAYADYVLGGDPKTQLRPWRQYADVFEFNHRSLYRRYAAASEPANLLLTTTESRLARTTPSEKYGSTFNTVDKIFAQKGIEGGGDYAKMNFIGTYIFTSSTAPVTTGRYLAKFDEFSTSESIGTKPRGLYVTNVLFTDEVLLNRMEAYAMLKNYSHAIDDLLQYMQGKFGFMPSVDRAVYTSTNSDNYNIYTPFYGLTLKQLAMVKLFLDFRQKEFYQEGLRWFDIRRFHLAVKRSSKSSYYFPLEKEDPRKVLQIPTEAIQRGLAANPRERQEPIR